MDAGYRIPDEPRPSGLSRVAVNPTWPLFAVMFAGSWLALPWFALNSAALGSATKGREIALALLGLVAATAIGVGVVGLLSTGAVRRADVPLLVLAVQVVKLGVAYALFAMQERSFQLHTYFGGAARSGFLVLAAGYLLRERVLELVPAALWLLVMA